MLSFPKFFILFISFLINEIKILKTKIQYIVNFINEINLINYFFFKKKDFFKIKIKNDYLKLLHKKFFNNENYINNSQKVFVESFINHPSYTIPNGYISKIISKNKNLECIGILRSGDIKGEAILKSFKIKKIIFINEGNIFKRFYYFCLAINYLKNIKTINKFIEFKINRIDFGKAIYEQFIRFKKNPNIYQIQNEFYILLGRALLLNDQFEKIFKNKNKSFLVQSETQYFPFRISFQNALKYKLKVVSKRGISKTGLRIYKNFSERNENRNKISKEFFNLYYKNLRKTELKKIQKFHRYEINKTFGKDTYQQLNSSKNSKIIIDNKNDFCKALQLENKYPIVLILAHELTDGNLINKWNIFQNDMFFMKDTLKKIKNINKINWIIKPHPSEEIFNSKITTFDLFNNHSKECKNIKLLPNDYLIKNPKKIYHCAITSHGTAGYEYPSLEIPTIICGDTPYSELGFNLEPKNKNKYFSLLKKIKIIKKLKKEQIVKSRLFYYLFNYICVVKNPLMYEADITMKYNKKIFWQKSLDILKKYKNFNHNFVNSLNHQIDNDNSILINLKRKD